MNGQGYHSCAVLSGGTVKCWGINSFGQIGDGTGTYKEAPVLVVKAIEALASATATIATSSLVISKPTGTVTDHVMVAGVTTRPSTTTITTPSGWTLLQSHATGNSRQSIYYRVATLADASVSDYTWTLSVSAKTSGAIITYANVDSSSPVKSSDGAASSNTITTSAGQQLLLKKAP